MLVILFGATLEMGYQSRCIFQDNGFDIIQKYNYVKDDARVNKDLYSNPEQDELTAKWYNDKIYVDSLEEIEKCDFQYGLDGVCVGFNKSQILDAVRGTTDAILTLGASSMDFIIMLKKAYGGYITLINIFSDDKTVASDNRLSKVFDENEIQTRVLANQKMQKLYLKNIDVFDEMVIYTGEKSCYDREALELQYQTIIYKSREVERELNSRNYVELPYKGNAPYLFISYAHKDIDKVYPELLYLQKNTYRIWYDDGINGGDNWRKILRDKISNCEEFLLFLSEDSIKSKDVQTEINLALCFEKKIIIVDIDKTEIPYEFAMDLQTSSKVFYDDIKFRNKLEHSLSDELKEYV